MNESAAATAGRWSEEEAAAEQAREFAEFQQQKRAGQVAAAAAAPATDARRPLNAGAAEQLADLGWTVIDALAQMLIGKRVALPPEKHAEFVKKSIPVVQLYVDEPDGADALLHPLVPLTVAVGGFYLEKYQQPEPAAEQTVDVKAKRHEPAPPRVVPPEPDEDEDDDEDHDVAN